MKFLTNSLLTSWLSKDIKKIASNFASLAAVQITNFVLPLLVIPYYLRIIGIEKFGVISIAQIVLLFCNVIVEYGFNLTATKEISINRFDNEKLNKIVSSVLFLKGVLLLVNLSLILIVFSFYNNVEYRAVILYGFFWVIGQALMPIWFFQGIEKMKFITIINLLSKIIFTLLIFVFLNCKDQYPMIHFFNGISLIFMGLISWGYIFSEHKISFTMLTKDKFKSEITQGWPIFISNFSITSYNNSNPLILRMFVSDAYVGYYSIAEKVIFALKQISGVFTQSVYPHLCKISIDSFISVKRMMVKCFVPLLFFLLVCGSILFIFSENITNFISGERAEMPAYLLRLMAFLPFISALNFAPYLVLVIYNFNRSLMIVILSGSILNILLNIILTYNFSLTGTVLAVILTEVYIVVGLYFMVEVEHKNYSLFKKR